MHLIVMTFRGAVIKVEVANFCAAMDTLIDQDRSIHIITPYCCWSRSARFVVFSLTRCINECKDLYNRWWKANFKASGPLPAPRSGHATSVVEGVLLLIYSPKKTQLATIYSVVPFTTPNPVKAFHRNLFITFGIMLLRDRKTHQRYQKHDKALRECDERLTPKCHKTLWCGVTEPCMKEPWNVAGLTRVLRMTQIWHFLYWG